MSDPADIGMGAAVVALIGAVGGLVTALIRSRSHDRKGRQMIETLEVESRERGSAVVIKQLQEMLDDLREERRQEREQDRAECDEQIERRIALVRAELARNTEATIEVAERVSPEVGRRARSHLSDPRGIPVQREDTGRHRQHRELPEVHTDLESERPFPPRPRRRTRDE